MDKYKQMKIEGEISGSFEDWVLSDPWFMHEYGHYIQSRHWGPIYFFGVGIPSWSAANKNHIYIKDDPYNRTMDDIAKVEMRANNRAAKYFRKYYGVDWDYLNTDGDERFWKFPLRYP